MSMLRFHVAFPLATIYWLQCTVLSMFARQGTRIIPYKLQAGQKVFLSGAQVPKNRDVE